MRTVIIISVVLFILLMVMKKTSNIGNESTIVDESSFIDLFVTWLKKKAGGLSNDKRDSASYNSWPNGYHTNKDITKTTFEGNASKCGYSATWEVFKAMPNDVWWCNYQQFWNLGKKWSDNIVLSIYMSQWYWGSGGWDQGSRYKINWSSKVSEILNSSKSNKEKLSDLVDLRILYFKKNVENNPENSVFLNGWIKKANEFRNNFSKFL